MLAEAVILSLIISLWFKGRFENFVELPIKCLYLPFMAFGFEYLGGFLVTSQVPVLIKNTSLITLLIEMTANGLLLFFFYINREIVGMKWICLGSLLNFIVIVSNFGYMPVDPSLGLEYGYETALMALKNGQVFAHTLMTETTHLNILGDWIMVPPPWPLPKTISIGDIIIDLGAFLLIFKGMTSGHARVNSV